MPYGPVWERGGLIPGAEHYGHKSGFVGSMFCVYVLRSLKDSKLYTGVTADLSRRLKAHNAGKTKSLRHRRPLVLVYCEAYKSKAEALARERYFKTPEGGAIKQRLVSDVRPPVA